MIILHISWLDNNKSNGVSNVVPLHIKMQKKIGENVALLNINDVNLDLISKNDVPLFNKKDILNWDINKLPSPFCKPDIVVFHGIYFLDYCKLALNFRRNKIPYLIVPHGDLTHFSQKRRRIKKIIGNNIFFNKFISGAEFIQYLSEGEKINTVKREMKSIVSGNGIDLPDKIEIKLASEKETFNITYIGRIEPYHKGLDLLIESAYKISTYMRENNILINLYGPDDHGGIKKIEKLINKYDLKDLIKIGPPLYDADKFDKLRKSDVFILTSRFEGQPLAAMEALANGIPVIVTPGTNISNLVRNYDAGWVADTDLNSISQKIKEAYDSKVRHVTLSKNAFLLAQNTFDWEAVAKQTVKLYGSLL